MLRYLATLLIMVIRWPTPVPFTSKDKTTYQIIGKITMSKEKKMNKKDFWVGRMLLITCSLSKQKTSLLFSKQTPILSKLLINLKTFSKDQHLCIHSYEQESLQSLLNDGTFSKYFQKPHKAYFQTKASDLERN